MTNRYVRFLCKCGILNEVEKQVLMLRFCETRYPEVISKKLGIPLDRVIKSFNEC